MGVDWIRRTEERFRHCLQEASATGFNPTPLFPAQEKVTVTYPCHWLREDQTLPVRTQLIIFQRGEKARVAVLYGKDAVAEVRGEAARDLKTLFSDHPELCNALAVKIVRVGKPTEPFYVQPIVVGRKKGMLQ